MLLFIQNLGGPAAAPAPTIFAGPQPQAVLAGQSATFNIVAGANGAALSFQWSANGNPIEGATGPSYTTPATTASMSGTLFACAVSTSGGSANSGQAALTVATPQVSVVSPLAAPGPVGICNVASTILGVSTIASLQDGTVIANAYAAMYDTVRQFELRAKRWRFAIARTTRAASSLEPASGPFNSYFPLPPDYLHVLEVGDDYPGADLTDYRVGPSDDGWAIEGRNIATNYGAPLWFKYVRNVTDTTQFDACFTLAFGAKLAWYTCETLTGSTEKRDLCTREYKDAISLAIRSNAFENIPEVPADDTWVMARLQ